MDSIRGGWVIESNHFPASVHHTQFESELDSITPPPRGDAELHIHKDIHNAEFDKRTSIEQAHAARLKKEKKIRGKTLQSKTCEWLVSVRVVGGLHGVYGCACHVCLFLFVCCWDTLV